MPKTSKPSKEKSVVREYTETILGAVALAAFIMIFVARAYTVDGPSMLPTLVNGERLLVDKVSYRLRDPKRGEIIVFRYPADPSQSFIKRIVGVPGDNIRIHGGVVYINDEPVQEEYIREAFFSRFGPEKVPPNTYFVMGDNRNNSEDSRDNRVGFVPENLVIGRALWRYWPIPKIGIMRLPQTLEGL